METESQILGADGKPIRTVQIPTLQVDDFVIGIDLVSDDEMVQSTKDGLRPGDLLKELRATNREHRHRFNIIMTLFSYATKGPEELKRAMDSMGLHVRDLNDKTIYGPEGK